MLVLTYINKKLVYVSNNYNSSNANDSNAWPVFDADGYKLPSGKEISGVEKIMFTAFEKADVTIYLDNCIVRRMNLTAPKVEEGDYTSRYDKDMSDNVDDGGSGDVGNSGGNTGGSSSGTNPSDGDIIGNLPNDTWKE